MSLCSWAHVKPPFLSHDHSIYMFITSALGLPMMKSGLYQLAEPSCLLLHLVSGEYFVVEVNMWYKNLHAFYLLTHRIHISLPRPFFLQSFSFFIPSLQPDSQAITHNPGIYMYSYLRLFVLLPEQMISSLFLALCFGKIFSLRHFQDHLWMWLQCSHSFLAYRSWIIYKWIWGFNWSLGSFTRP